MPLIALAEAVAVHPPPQETPVADILTKNCTLPTEEVLIVYGGSPQPVLSLHEPLYPSPVARPVRLKLAPGVAVSQTWIVKQKVQVQVAQSSPKLFPGEPSIQPHGSSEV